MESGLAAHPAPLTALVEHQPSAVVSRVLAKTGGGSVTVFAFDAGEELSEHTASFDALVYVAHGRLKIRIHDGAHTVECGEILRLPAHVPHAVHAPVPAKMLLVMLREPVG